VIPVESWVAVAVVIAVAAVAAAPPCSLGLVRAIFAGSCRVRLMAPVRADSALFGLTGMHALDSPLPAAATVVFKVVAVVPRGTVLPSASASIKSTLSVLSPLSVAPHETFLLVVSETFGAVAIIWRGALVLFA
jgi:hypothetical protein